MLELPYESKEFKLAEVAENGTFDGLASVYGVKDLVGDVVTKGAFTRTIKNHEGVVPLLWQHDQHAPIGTVELQDTEKGLAVKGTIALGVQAGKEAYELIKQRSIKGLSIGYDPIDWSFDKDVRQLKEVRLWEVSLVTFPANPSAMVASVKSKQPGQFEAALQTVLEAKEGRVLSTANKRLLQQAMEALQSLLLVAEPPTDGNTVENTPNTLQEGLDNPATVKAATVCDPDTVHSLMEVYNEMKMLSY